MKSTRYTRIVMKHYFLSNRKRNFAMNVKRFSKLMSEHGKAQLYRDPNESPVSPVMVKIKTAYGVAYHLFEDHLQAWTMVDKINSGVKV